MGLDNGPGYIAHISLLGFAGAFGIFYGHWFDFDSVCTRALIRRG